jgi:hypothetical protein
MWDDIPCGFGVLLGSVRSTAQLRGMLLINKNVLKMEILYFCYPRGKLLNARVFV